MALKLSRSSGLRLLCLCVALFIPASSNADLDVGTPPGTPWEWFLPGPNSNLRIPTRLLKERVATSSPQKGKGKEASGGKRTVTRKRKFHTADRPQSIPPTKLRATTMDLLKITTVDIFRELSINLSGELPRSPKTVARKRPTTGDRYGLEPGNKGLAKPNWGKKTKAAYPPIITEDTLLLAFTAIFRKLFHPNTLIESELIEYLSEIGLPSLIANDYSRTLGGKSRLSKVRSQVLARVTAFPSKGPRYLKSANDEESMLLHLVAEELAKSYSHTIYRPLGRFTLSLLPERIIPVIAAYLHPDVHPLLQQNAVSVLASYRGQDLQDPLFFALQHCSDDVARDRAIKALARQGSQKIMPILKSWSTSKDMSKRCLSLTLLRELRHQDGWLIGAQTLQHMINRVRINLDSVDEFHLAILVLGSSPGDKDESKLLLEKAKIKIAKLADRLDETAGKTPDIPDPKGLRLKILNQLIDLALVRKGDGPARVRVEKILKIPASSRRHIRNRISDSETFGAFEPINLLFLIETLPLMGDKGTERLKLILSDEKCRFPLRKRALQLLKEKKELSETTLEELIKSGDPRMRRLALLTFVEITPDKAEQIAKDFLSSFTQLQFMHPEVTEQEFDATAGIEALRKLGKGTVEELAKALKQARKFEIARLKAPPPKKKGLSLGIGFKVYKRESTLLIEVIDALGDLTDEKASQALAEYVAQKGGEYRAQAALNLGGCENKVILKVLVKALESKDPWLRYCSFRALRETGGSEADFFCDWIFASKGERGKKVRKFKRWLSKRKS